MVLTGDPEMLTSTRIRSFYAIGAGQYWTSGEQHNYETSHRGPPLESTVQCLARPAHIFMAERSASRMHCLRNKMAPRKYLTCSRDT